MELDKQVQEAMETRQEEYEDNVNTMASNTAATELIEFAKNRFMKFYNPKLHKPPAELVQVGRVLEDDAT